MASLSFSGHFLKYELLRLKTMTRTDSAVGKTSFLFLSLLKVEHRASSVGRMCSFPAVLLRMTKRLIYKLQNENCVILWFPQLG